MKDITPDLKSWACRPAMSDEQVKQLLDEERMLKYQSP